ncbi:hypothetical protein BD289DRAFT_123894 [Coniella lustricola]|uniref:Uncharacterized protein n=1 Tax=Coniella lustricola TaxID=2025994 RepID=A0A2T2ZWE8_9PEZI|nr:hypothetical protein BD289DRAFT_123894 [Coniella lustricola]
MQAQRATLQSSVSCQYLVMTRAHATRHSGLRNGGSSRAFLLAFCPISHDEICRFLPLCDLVVGSRKSWRGTCTLEKLLSRWRVSVAAAQFAAAQFAAAQKPSLTYCCSVCCVTKPWLKGYRSARLVRISLLRVLIASVEVDIDHYIKPFLQVSSACVCWPSRDQTRRGLVEIIAHASASLLQKPSRDSHHLLAGRELLQ